MVLKTEDIKLDIRDGFEELEMTLREAETHKEKSEEVEDKLAEVQEVLSSFKGLDNSKEREGLKGEIRDSEDQVEVFDNSLDQLENKKELLLSLIQKTNVKLSGTITCPSCAHDFVLDGDLDELKSQKIAAEKLSVRLDKRIEDQQAAQNILNDQIVTFFEQIKELKLLEEKSLEGKSDLIKAVQEVQKNHSNHLTKGGRLSREVSDIKDGIADYKRDIEMSNEAIKNNKIIISSQNENIATFNETIKALKLKMSSVKKSDNKEILKSLAKDISKLEIIKKKLQKEESSIGDKIYQKNQWKSIFKNFRLHLANQSLEVIEYHSNRYLAEMKSDLRIKLEGYKTLADGSIKDEITTKIIRDRERTFSSFSGGEKGRLLFASILANRHMINSTHRYGGLDFLSIDEIFEGVDGVGLKSLVDSAKLLNIAVMIITHVTDEQVSEDILLIEKENGISTIKNN